MEYVVGEVNWIFTVSLHLPCRGQLPSYSSRKSAQCPVHYLYPGQKDPVLIQAARRKCRARVTVLAYRPSGRICYAGRNLAELIHHIAYIIKRIFAIRGKSPTVAGYFIGNLVREMAHLTRWTRQDWARRCQAILVSDEDVDQVDRLTYMLANIARRAQGRSTRNVTRPVACRTGTKMPNILANTTFPLASVASAAGRAFPAGAQKMRERRGDRSLPLRRGGRRVRRTLGVGS